MTETVAKKKPSGWLNLLVDYGPILIFFAVYKYYSPADREDAIGEVLAVIRGTGTFMVAAVIALIISKWKIGRISRMLWLSTALIVFFGGLTILLHDPFWIQIKPTVIYMFFGLTLLGGWMRGISLLKYLLGAAFEGLNDKGWMILSRNWGIFFLFFAALNEALRHYLSFGDWLASKGYVFLPRSFVFTFVHVPMLLRHGMAQEAEGEAVTETPHE
jgi:intracellular septation protein